MRDVGVLAVDEEVVAWVVLARFGYVFFSVFLCLSWSPVVAKTPSPMRNQPFWERKESSTHSTAQEPPNPPIHLIPRVRQIAQENSAEMMDVEPIVENVQRGTNAIATLFVPKLDVSLTAREAFNAVQMGVVEYVAPALWEKAVHPQGSASPMDALPIVKANSVVPMDVETSAEPVRAMNLAVQMASALPFVKLPAWVSLAETTAVEDLAGAALASKSARLAYANRNALQIAGGSNAEMMAVEDCVACALEANYARTRSAEMPVRQIVRPNNVELMGVVEAAESALREPSAQPMGCAPSRVKKEAEKKEAGAESPYAPQMPNVIQETCAVMHSGSVWGPVPSLFSATWYRKKRGEELGEEAPMGARPWTHRGAEAASAKVVSALKTPSAVIQAGTPSALICVPHPVVDVALGEEEEEAEVAQEEESVQAMVVPSSTLRAAEAVHAKAASAL